MPKLAKLYDPETGSRLLTVPGSAKYLGYHEYSIYRLILKGALKPHRRTGRTLLFLKEELDRFKARSAWWARKSSSEPPKEDPPMLPSNLKATVIVNVGIKNFPHPDIEEVIPNFTWEQIPLVHAQVQNKYGQRPSDIYIQGPDGGSWKVSYDPPSWAETAVKKWKKMIKG